MGPRPVTAVEPSPIVAHRRYPDGSCVAFSGDIPGFFWAVSPKGLRLRDSETGLVRQHPTWQHAAADLMTLGYGPESGFGVVVVPEGDADAA